MQLRAAIISVKRITLAVILVGPDAIQQDTRATTMRHVQQYFPAHPILLLAPRANDEPLAYATFQFEQLLQYIDPDDYSWDALALPELVAPLPF